MLDLSIKFLMRSRRILQLVGILACLLQVYPLTQEDVLASSRKLTTEVSSLPGCNVLHASWIGDGWCDNDEYNTSECNYDMGDCCQSTCNPAIHADCGVVGYKCKNPSAKENKPPSSKGGSGGSGGSDGSDGSSGGGGNGNSSGGGGNGNSSGGGGSGGGSSGGSSGGGGSGGSSDGGGSGGGSSGGSSGGGGSGSGSNGGNGGDSNGSNGGGSNGGTDGSSGNGGGSDGSGSQQVYMELTWLMMNCTDFDDYSSSNYDTVSMIQQTIIKAYAFNVAQYSSTTVSAAKFAPYSNYVAHSMRGYSLDGQNRSIDRNLGTSQDTMIAVTISMQTQSSYANKESVVFNQSIYSGLLQSSLRRTSRQSSITSLNWVKVCRSNVASACMAEISVDPNRGHSSRAQVKLDQCSMSSSQWDRLYEREAQFRGYVIWLSVLIILWVCIFAIATGPIIFLRFDLWPSLKMCTSKSSGRLLDAARFNQGCTVALMSVCRIVHIALIISVSFDANAPTYACVEFSFNRRISDGIISYSTPLLEVIQGIFYPIFLLAVLARQEWYDAELRQIGVLVHVDDSRRHMVLCFLLRRFLAAVALVFFVGQITMLIIISIRKQASDPTPASLGIWMKTSQICCALLVILIQLYHLKAITGVSAVHGAETDVPDERGKNGLLSGMEDGQKSLKEKDFIDSEDNRELSYSEIVTGDRSHCGYSSHQQRTETYVVGKIADYDQDEEIKTDAEEQANKIERVVVTGKKHPSRQSAYESLGDSSRTAVAGEVPENDMAGLLIETHHVQLSGPHHPVVTDHITWIAVLATCVCFLITSIPASLRSYLSAFLLYSLASRVLEIAAASLLLSPFNIQNSSLRRRLAAKLMEGAALSVESPATTILCGRESSHVVIPGDAMGRRKKGDRYSEIIGTDISPSSLTVSIMHKPTQPSAAPRGKPDSDYRETTMNKDTAKNNGSNCGSRRVTGTMHQSDERSEDHKRQRLLKEESLEFIYNKPDGENAEKLICSGGPGDAWVDRWAKSNINDKMSDSSLGPLLTELKSAPTGMVSPVSSATSATAHRRQSGVLINPAGSVSKASTSPSPSTLIMSHKSNHQVSEEQELGGKIKESKLALFERNYLKSTVKVTQSGHDGNMSHKPKQENMDSPRSVATAVNESISPLTGSVVTSHQLNINSKVMNIAATPVSNIIRMANTRPQVENEIAYSDQTKVSDTISVNTKKEISDTRYKKETNGKLNPFYDKWASQSPSQSQHAKLTRRGVRIGGDDKSPTIKSASHGGESSCYDGDAEKEKIYPASATKKAGLSPGWKATPRTAASPASVGHSPAIPSDVAPPTWRKGSSTVGSNVEKELLITSPRSPTIATGSASGLRSALKET